MRPCSSSAATTASHASTARVRWRSKERSWHRNRKPWPPPRHSRSWAPSWWALPRHTRQAPCAARALPRRCSKATSAAYASRCGTASPTPTGGTGTDRALVAGVLGLSCDDERIRNAFDLARERGLEVEFAIAGDDATLHPNTVDIDLTDSEGTHADVRGESLGGGRMRISRNQRRGRRYLRHLQHAVRGAPRTFPAPSPR